MENVKRMILFLTLLVLTVGGCASSMSPDSYSRSQARQVQTVEEGEVIYVREVMIEGTKSGFGTIAGAALGYSLGRTIGGGSGTKIAKTAGAVGGAMAGSAIEEKATQQKALEITVKLDNGEVIAIVQAADVPFDEGDSVRVIRRPNGEARVVQ